jgi:hypothetical protein
MEDKRRSTSCGRVPQFSLYVETCRQRFSLSVLSQHEAIPIASTSEEGKNDLCGHSRQIKVVMSTKYNGVFSSSVKLWRGFQWALSQES